MKTRLGIGWACNSASNPCVSAAPRLSVSKKPVEPNHVRQIVVKVGQADVNAILPKLLSDADVPAEIFFRFQIEVVSENFVLTARRTEPSRNAGVQRRICFVDLVAAGNAISPDAAELLK